MAHDARYPASSATARGPGFSTMPTQGQGTTFAATAVAIDPISSEPSSSPSRGASSLLPDMADLRDSHNRRLSAASHGLAVPGASAAGASGALFPRRSSSSSSPRARNPDLHHAHSHHHHTYHSQHHHHHHVGRARGEGSAGASRPSTLQRVASEIRRLTRTPDTAQAALEDDWSVFGEAMAHEVHSATPPPPPGIVLPDSHTPVSTSAGEAGNSPAQWTQSPVSDAHIEDFFPTVEEGDEGDERVERQSFDRRSSLDTGLLASFSHVDSDTESSTPLLSPKDVDPKDHGLRRDLERWWKRISYLPTLPTLYRNILKCSLAYFLGSLFTYYTPLSRFISEVTQDGPGEKYPSAMGHMVATV